jgi:hypothetical protein
VRALGLPATPSEVDGELHVVVVTPAATASATRAARASVATTASSRRASILRRMRACGVRRTPPASEEALSGMMAISSCFALQNP